MWPVVPNPLQQSGRALAVRMQSLVVVLVVLLLQSSNAVKVERVEAV